MTDMHFMHCMRVLKKTFRNRQEFLKEYLKKFF